MPVTDNEHILSVQNKKLLVSRHMMILEGSG